MPSLSALSISPSSSFPKIPRLPNRPLLKRQPSSSANEITSIDRSGFIPFSDKVITTSMAQSTPATPSNRPPYGWLSRCEPIINTGNSGCDPSSLPIRFPKLSMRVVMPASCIHDDASSKASISNGVNVGRQVPVSPSLPISDMASKCCCSLVGFIIICLFDC